MLFLDNYRLHTAECLDSTGKCLIHRAPMMCHGLEIVIALHACMLSHFSRVQLSATPWTVARQAPLSIGFSRQEYWSGLPCPLPGDLPDSGLEPASLMSLHWQVGSLPLVPPGKPIYSPAIIQKKLKHAFSTMLKRRQHVTACCCCCCCCCCC